MHLFARTGLLFALCLADGGSVASVDTIECPVELPCFCADEIRGGDHKVDIECQNRGLYNFPVFKANSTQKIDKILFRVNYIRQIPEKAFGLTKPRVIDVSNNEISYIHDDAFAGVEDHVSELILSSNGLMTWPVTGISRLSALEKIDLRYNQGVSSFDENSFVGLENLREIIIGNCRRQLYIHDSAFRPLTNLAKLKITSCSMDSVPSAIKNLTNLEELDMSSNFIQKIPPMAFRGLTNLKSLRLGLNLLEHADSLGNESFADLTNLEELYVDNCGLSSLPPNSLRHLKKLKKLVLSFNNLTIVNASPFRGLESLEELVLDDNPIIYSAGLLSGLEDILLSVSLKSQGLTELPLISLRPLRKLTTIDASNNEIEIVKSDFRNGLSAFRYHLDGNSIKSVDPDAFYETSRRFELYLTNNELRSFGFVGNPERFSVVDARNNPIECDCYTYRLTKVETLLVTGTCKSPIEKQPIGGVEFNSAMFFKCIANVTDYGREYTKQTDPIMADPIKQTDTADEVGPCIKAKSSAVSTAIFGEFTRVIFAVMISFALFGILDRD